MINWLTPISSTPTLGHFVSEIKQKQSECDSCRNTNSACDSVGDSLLPTSSAHTIIHPSSGPGAKDCRGESPALFKQWVGLGCVRRRVGCMEWRGGSEVSLIIQEHTLTFRSIEHVSRTDQCVLYYLLVNRFWFNTSQIKSTCKAADEDICSIFSIFFYFKTNMRSSPWAQPQMFASWSHERALTSKSWYCSSVRDFLETTRTLSPSLAMFPH